MLERGCAGGRANGRRDDRVHELHTPALVRTKPKQIKGMIAHVTARSNGSQGKWSRELMIARVVAVEKSALLRGGWFDLLSPAESGSMLVRVGSFAPQMFVSKVRRALEMLVRAVAIL